MSRLGATTGGVWVAFHQDGSGFVVFSTEIEALRYALANTMSVRHARFGDPDWRTRPDEPTPEPPPFTLHNEGGGICRGFPAESSAESLGRVGVFE